MAKACATLAEFLAIAPEFKTVGPQSAGSVTVASQPAPGDTFTLADSSGLLPVVESFEAGVDFSIGVDEAATAANLAAAISLGALATSAALGATLTIVSASTGPVSLLGMTTSNPVALVLSGPTLTGGDAQVLFALGCACSQINLGCWGDKADCGHVYLTAYLLSSATGAGGGGTVSSKKIDKISVAYAVATPSGADALLQSNKWGALYLQMRRSLFVAPIPGRRFFPVVC